MQVQLRPFNKDLDYGFLIATWPKAIYYGSAHSGNEHERNLWFKAKYDLINTMLQNPRWEIRIACVDEDPSFILGYSVTMPNRDSRLVHFVYVKKGYRKQGIGKLLTGPERIDVSKADWTDIGRLIHDKDQKSEVSPSS
jgi:GNAT superfamily N-acetyltransferase